MSLSTQTDAGGFPLVGAVIIGRNEGQRLVRCLAASSGIPRRVYVDSGSTDGSLEIAQAAGARVVQLQVPPKFTAARARNEGIRYLLAQFPDTQVVQTLDGDCELIKGWLEIAVPFLNQHQDFAAVYGRTCERNPDQSVYNALCDDEWNTGLTDTGGFGGNALIRVAALQGVNFYNPAMIAAEDSELSYRMRTAGWKLKRMNQDMVWHDVAIVSFGQWWSRARRAGHGFAELNHLHPHASSMTWSRSVKSMIVWGAAWPLSTAALWVIGLVFAPAMWLALAATLFGALRVVSLALREHRRGLSRRVANASAILLMIGKAAGFLGLVRFYSNKVLGKQSELIEYKGPQ